jgi:hypothetical protein
VAALGLTPRPRSRCTVCNAPLLDARPEELAQVPPYVRRLERHFTRCPECRRIYWRGTHARRMRETLDRALV